jgi:hypothetical protein
MSDATGAAEALLGLPGFLVLDVQEDPGEIIVVVELVAGVVGCPGCGVIARSHGRTEVDYRELACFGRPARPITTPDPRIGCRSCAKVATKWQHEAPRRAETGAASGRPEPIAEQGKGAAMGGCQRRPTASHDPWVAGFESCRARSKCSSRRRVGGAGLRGSLGRSVAVRSGRRLLGGDAEAGERLGQDLQLLQVE